MRVLDVKQGSREWVNARLGIPTASCFNRIITPKTRKPSEQAGKYMAQLLTEHYFGHPLDDYVNSAIERGTDLENEAATFYASVNDVAVKEVGFCLRDDGKVGASPDRLVDNDGVLEIKCPLAKTHVLYMLHNDDLVSEYWCQVQGECWIAERKWVDLLSYHPSLPHVCVRVDRDDAFIAALAKTVDDFVVRLDEAKAKMTPRKKPDPDEVRDDDPFATADEPTSLQDALKGNK